MAVSTKKKMLKAFEDIRYYKPKAKIEPGLYVHCCGELVHVLGIIVEYATGQEQVCLEIPGSNVQAMISVEYFLENVVLDGTTYQHFALTKRDSDRNLVGM